MKTVAAVIGIILFVAFMAWGIFHWHSGASVVVLNTNDPQVALDANAFSASADQASTSVDALVADAPSKAPAGWLPYRSAQYHFAFYYPPELSVKTYDEGGGAITITLQSIKPVEGFQIFIVPYSGTQISEQRFEEDEPTHIRNNVQNALIDGVQAVTFNSTDPSLGDTAEAWFIKGGYLYEVTTLKPLDQWLGQIMQTWQFI